MGRGLCSDFFMFFNLIISLYLLSFGKWVIRVLFLFC